jgi:uncharacterized protein (TIGR01777 family)
MKVVISGGTGLIGRQLVQSLLADGNEIVVLTRHLGSAQAAFPPAVRPVVWDARTVNPSWTQSLAGAEAVINLAGASIGGQPWTSARKRVILKSRVEATRAIVKGIATLPTEQRPKVLVSASGIDFYGDRGDEIVTEESGPGSSFLAGVCVEWENAAMEVIASGVRVVCLRTSVVFAKNAMTLRLMAFPFRLFVGGALGNGRQWFSWIHLDDVVGLYRLAIEQNDLAGGVNAVAPDARRSGEVAAAIGTALGRPSWIPAPSPMLRLLLRDQADLLLHGRRAVPARALAAGYSFKYPNLQDALRESLGPA